ncbi:MAG: hypothetical protein EBU18_03650 [Rhodobacteraceae bacterium]|nr:hypothetical protein [Paracoccaceae bacterium]
MIPSSYPDATEIARLTARMLLEIKAVHFNANQPFKLASGLPSPLVEDLTTDGGSKLSFVDAIRETGATCAHTAVIFYYGIFPETEKTLGDHGVALHSLCTWWDVLAEAKAQGSFDANTLTEVEAFLNAPRDWQEANKDRV